MEAVSPEGKKSRRGVVALLVVLAPFVAGFAAALADGLNGGDTEDEGWEEGVILAAAIVATLVCAVLGGWAVGRQPKSPAVGVFVGLLMAVVSGAIGFITYLFLVVGVLGHY